MSAVDAERYDTTANPLLALEARIAVPLLPDLQGRLAIDVGGGTGRWSGEFLRRGARVVTIDLSESMLRRSAGAAVIADARALPLPDSCAHFAISAFAFSYTGATLDELARITRPGAIVVASDMHPDAIDHGWSRFAPVRARYSINDLHHPSLRRTQLIEACFDESDLALYRQAGRPGLIETVRGVRAVFVAAWERL